MKNDLPKYFNENQISFSSVEDIYNFNLIDSIKDHLMVREFLNQ